MYDLNAVNTQFEPKRGTTVHTYLCSESKKKSEKGIQRIIQPIFQTIIQKGIQYRIQQIIQNIIQKGIQHRIRNRIRDELRDTLRKRIRDIIRNSFPEVFGMRQFGRTEFNVLPSVGASSYTSVVRVCVRLRGILSKSKTVVATGHGGLVPAGH